MRTFKVLFFTAINLAVICLLNFVLLKPSTLKLKVNEINVAGKSGNDYDFIAIGQSLIQAGIDPEILDERLGCHSYNCAVGSEQITTLQFLLDEIDAHNQIKTIVFGLNATYWTGYDSAGYGTGVLEFATSIPTKINYIANEMLFKKRFTDFAMYDLNLTTLRNIPIYSKIKSDRRYRNPLDETLEWVNLTLAEHDRQTHNCYEFRPRGFNYGFELRPESNAYYKPLIFATRDVPEDKVASFEQFVKECNKRNINLICISSAMSPHRLSKENYSDVHTFFSELCQKNGVPYYDMTFAPSLSDRTDNDYLDWDGHMMGSLAQKQTRFLCDVLTSQEPENYFYKNYADLMSAMKITIPEIQ